MRILIVEDDGYKSMAVENWLKYEYPDIKVDVKNSYRDGCISALDGEYDILILDMALPSRTPSLENNSDTIVNGGELIIRELLDEHINLPSLILTQYETFNGETIESISERLHILCGETFLGCFSYNSQDDSWKNNVKIILDNVKGINR